MLKKWWKESVVYQIYPRTFMDSNGDGIGDIRGIISKLSYLEYLGVNIIWICPVYQSPNMDNGYDVSDYKTIADEFGTMDDFDNLIEQAHKKGIKIIIDFVLNHTSDQHPWFIESKKSKENPYRDYYIWKEGSNDNEPNNWKSIFGGSTWELEENTGEYYFHLFLKEQPDLNWENEKVRDEMYALMKWWLDKGIDGFRLDATTHIKKDQGFPFIHGCDEGKYVRASHHYTNQFGLHEFLNEMKEQVFNHYNIMTVAESSGVSCQDALHYVHETHGEVNMLTHFEHLGVDRDYTGKWFNKQWYLSDVKDVFSKWQKALEFEGWNSQYLENHDQPRSVSRFGNDTSYLIESAKMLSTFYFLLKGTPFIFQGQEIGMTNIQLKIEDYQDAETLKFYKEAMSIGKNEADVMHAIHRNSRDNARTPMQWDNTKNAGFTNSIPCMSVNANYSYINVKDQMNDPDSILNYYKKLIQIRKDNPVIVYGSYILILEEHQEIYAFIRQLGNEKLLVICNFFEGTPVFKMPDWIDYSLNVLLISNYNLLDETFNSQFELKPYETRVYLLK